MSTLPYDPELTRAMDEPRDPNTGELLDCTRCGACCHGGEGKILVSEDDLVRWRRSNRDDLVEQTTEGHFGMRAFLVNAKGACVHLTWPEGKSICSIYEERAEVCREFQAGSWQCIEFRKDFFRDKGQ